MQALSCYVALFDHSGHSQFWSYVSQGRQHDKEPRLDQAVQEES